jgi:hypothetical protein
MIIRKSASWVSDYQEKSLGEINGTKTTDLDFRVEYLIKLRNEIDIQIQRELDNIYMVVNNRINYKLK